MAVGDEPASAPARGFKHLLLIINRGHWPHLLENDMKQHIETLLDYLTAVAIGVGLAALLVAWWSS